MAEVVGEERAKEFAITNARAGLECLEGRAVINVNSTAAGGGVAEMSTSCSATSGAWASTHDGS